MTSKTVIAIAVATAVGWPLVASANPDMRSSDSRDGARATGESYHGRFMHRSTDLNRSDVSAWEVATPFSPNEVGPTSWPDNGRIRTEAIARAEHEAPSPAVVTEIMTPFSPEENGPVVRPQRRHDVRLATVRSLPNPQTPASTNESDNSRVTYDAMAYREQVAEIDRIHMAAASAVGTTVGGFEERAMSRNEELPPAPEVEQQSALVSEPRPGEVSALPGDANEAAAEENQTTLAQSEHSIGLQSRDRRTFNAERDTARTEPLAPESGVATTPPSVPESTSDNIDTGSTVTPSPMQ